jgi:hypothetical protein
MKYFFILIIVIATVIFNFKADCQITKTNWMVGGNASFLFTNASTGSEKSKSSNLSIAPNIGYFFIDKFVAGLQLSYNRSHTKSLQTAVNSNFNSFITYSAGPFVRYYLLPVDQKYNIITEGNYQFGNEKVKTNNFNTNLSSNSFSFSAGPVIYFNSSVGMEFLFNYIHYENNYTENVSRNSFGAGIGLQVYLEKEKY